MQVERDAGLTHLGEAVIVLRVDGATHVTETDRVAIEAALEVRLGDAPFSVIMRTPGDDEALALGFLFSEGVIRTAADVAMVSVVADDVVRVDLTDARAAVVPDMLAGRRQVAMTSSCGLCGRLSIASLAVDAPPLDIEWSVPIVIVLSMPLTLRDAQSGFSETGGLHAAGLFDRDGRLEAVAEDVGRHNAVDKLVGRMLRAGRLPLGDTILFVSGRSSFEIVQKAWLAGVPMVAGVSAPSSLAVSLAADAGLTLAGFVRDGRCNVYAHPTRLALVEAD